MAKYTPRLLRFLVSSLSILVYNSRESKRRRSILSQHFRYYRCTDGKLLLPPLRLLAYNTRRRLYVTKKKFAGELEHRDDGKTIADGVGGDVVQ